MEYEENISHIISKHLEAALGDFGELIWAYVVLSKKDMSCIFGVTNYPGEWVKQYKEQGLQYTDPVVITALNRLTPFAWDENLMAGAGFRFSELFEQAREFGVADGYTFVLHDFNNNLVTLSFTLAAERKAETMQMLNQHKGDISLLLASTHEMYLTLTSLSEKNTARQEKNARFTERKRDPLLGQRGENLPGNGHDPGDQNLHHQVSYGEHCQKTGGGECPACYPFRDGTSAD